MIARRGTLRLEETIEIRPKDEVVVIEAFDESERRRAHELMMENWELIALVRKRTEDGAHYTEYHLRAPRP
jgi:hypothetical protein